MEHTISLHDSTPEPSPESFDVSASYEAYEEPTPLHSFVSAEPVSDGWVQEEASDEPEPEYEPMPQQHAHHEHAHHEHTQHENMHHEQAHHEQAHHEIHAVPEAPAPVAAAPDTNEFRGSAGERRVVLQMTDGQTVELRRMWDADEAVAFARDAVRRIAAAEASGEWPEIDGRFMRADSIFSVDIQVAE